MKNVIKAITYNKKQLILTAMLGLFIIYIYSLFAYYFINDTFFFPAVGVKGENICTTVVHCFTTVISLVIYSITSGSSFFRKYWRRSSETIL